MNASAPTPSPIARSWWPITLFAAALLMITMGSRQSMGLFLSPINTDTGLGVVTLSFALAVGQFVWGAVQPITGAIADRYGPGRVLAGGIVLLAAGTALTPFMTSAFGMTIVLGVLVAAGAGACSFSVLIGAVSQYVPASSRGTASGVINAGSSLGQFVFAPVAQALIAAVGWMGAMWSLAALTLASLPITRLMRRAPQPGVAANTGTGLRQAVREAFANRSYLLLHAGFFTCGFHIAFLVTHLPGEVGLCGLPPTVASWSLALIGLANIAGSLLAGQAVNRFRSKYILFWMYLSRAVLVVAYLAAPKTALTFYLLAIGLGLTWLGTVPPTAGVVAKLFGVRYLATLFGMTLLSHQIGGFFGAWLGGLAVAGTGSYLWMWYADAVLALAAALVNLPIREPVVERAPA
ncbi:MAG: MFS transporter [Burkholderiales bacterium]|jgi:predicted MFS family arabinose efflux permease